MSHSRILVLEGNRFYINCDDIFDTMQSYGNGVDYVTESESKYENDLDWFIKYAEDLGITQIEKGFKIDSICTFWTEMHEDVLRLLEDGLPTCHWQLVERLRMVHGFWIYYQDSLWTLPHFMEQVKDGDTFTVKKFLDYHF